MNCRQLCDTRRVLVSVAVVSLATESRTEAAVWLRDTAQGFYKVETGNNNKKSYRDDINSVNLPLCHQDTSLLHISL